MAHQNALISQKQMVTDIVANNGGDDDQQQQQLHQLHQQQLMLQQQQRQLLQQNYLQTSQQIDVRMKRHPELQPYVPSDRGHRNDAPIIASKINTNRKPVTKLKTTTNQSTNDAKSSAIKTDNNSSSNAKPKKCVSMLRLDQLAQPKKISTRKPSQTASTVPSSSLTSSNTTSTTASSLTSNKNYPQSRSATNQQRPSSSTATNISIKKTQQSPQLQPKQVQPPKQQAQSQQKHKQQQQQKREELPQNQEKKVSIRRQSMQEKQELLQQEQKRQQERQQQQIEDEQKFKIESTQQAKSEPNALVANGQQLQSTPDHRQAAKSFETPDSISNKIIDRTFDTGKKLFLHSPNAQASLWDELNDDTSIQQVPKQQDESNTTDQFSELSINDRHYQSATSDLAQEAETSTNGVGYHMDLGSLFKNLETDLIAQGIVKPNQSMTMKNDIEQEPPKEMMNSIEKELSNEEEEKRLKAEEELKEVARREEEERQTRQSIVDSILSKINQSS